MSEQVWMVAVCVRCVDAVRWWHDTGTGPVCTACLDDHEDVAEPTEVEEPEILYAPDLGGEG